MKTLSPANKPAHDFTCLLLELRQPDSRAVYSWDEADRIRESIESDSRPLPATPAPRRHLNIKFEKPVSFSKQFSQSNSASRNWHRKKALEFKSAGLNWRGEPFKNERRTRPLVNPDLPPKLYLDHAAYMAAWRAKKRKEKTMAKEMTIKITSDEVMELRMIRDDLVKRRPVGVAVQTIGPVTVRGTDETRDFDHKIETINAILKRAATS